MMKNHPILEFVCGVVAGPVLIWVFLFCRVAFLCEFLPGAKDSSRGIIWRIYLFLYGFVSCIVVPIVLIWPLFDRLLAIAGCVIGGSAFCAMFLLPPKKNDRISQDDSNDEIQT
jgi:hypothetical protein